MFRRIKKGDYVIGLRAIGAGGWVFRRGSAVVRGIYIGRMRGWYMVQTRRGRVWLCSDISKHDV